MIKRRGWLGWVAGVALWGAVCGCGGELAPGRAYTGKVEATDARVALVEQGDLVRAYVCGRPASFQDLSRWYTLRGHETAQGVLEIEVDNVDAKALIDELKKRTRSTGRAKGGKMMTAHKR